MVITRPTHWTQSFAPYTTLLNLDVLIYNLLTTANSAELLLMSRFWQSTFLCKRFSLYLKHWSCIWIRHTIKLNTRVVFKWESTVLFNMTKHTSMAVSTPVDLFTMTAVFSWCVWLAWLRASSWMGQRYLLQACWVVFIKSTYTLPMLPICVVFTI